MNIIKPIKKEKEFQEDSEGVTLFSPNLKLWTEYCKESVAVNNGLENT